MFAIKRKFYTRKLLLQFIMTIVVSTCLYLFKRRKYQKLRHFFTNPCFVEVIITTNNISGARLANINPTQLGSNILFFFPMSWKSCNFKNICYHSININVKTHLWLAALSGENWRLRHDLAHSASFYTKSCAINTLWICQALI